ncbi:MAG: polysaccharide biosynthesis/export family protein [Acidobacteriaceae bacterium]
MSELHARVIAIRFALPMLFAALAFGQAASPPLVPSSVQTPDASQAPEVALQLAQRYPRYVIQRQDVLRISFPLSPELNQTVTVQPDGFIDLQSAKSIHIQGLTVPQTIVAIKHAYTGVLRDPIVDVDLTNFQKPFFTVTGQVGKPGQYDLRSNLTVTEAIAVAGGLAPTAKTQVFLFHRANLQWFQVEKLNLKDVFNGKKANEDAILRPGDMIYVPESKISKFRKYVPYSVNAGSYLAENQN